ncbi:YbaY family lipoprotein [Sphingopyxis sp.]|uniref:YbaY family lipoprotein n=1 Tax=Sphingopyxis sp. TaxID=1908224 RepID=UPI002B48CCDC|nr:YbaY family lipoprotein [Sphingopyxis sp.]HJS11995.1 YbaY family lipoprotein [Sphingopyxis sp.]
MIRFAAAFALGLSTFALSACASTGEAANQQTTVSGKIAYRERIALPPSAQIEVRLDDVSLADAPARNIARQAFAADGKQVPIAFLLRFDRSAIDPKHSYAVSARITGDDGKLMFITDTRNSVTFDAGSEIDVGTLNLVKTN